VEPTFYRERSGNVYFVGCSVIHLCLQLTCPDDLKVLKANGYEQISRDYWIDRNKPTLTHIKVEDLHPLDWTEHDHQLLWNNSRTAKMYRRAKKENNCKQLRGIAGVKTPGGIA